MILISRTFPPATFLQCRSSASVYDSSASVPGRARHCSTWIIESSNLLFSGTNRLLTCRLNYLRSPKLEQFDFEFYIDPISNCIASISLSVFSRCLMLRFSFAPMLFASFAPTTYCNIVLSRLRKMAHSVHSANCPWTHIHIYASSPYYLFNCTSSILSSAPPLSSRLSRSLCISTYVAHTRSATVSRCRAASDKSSSSAALW